MTDAAIAASAPYEELLRSSRAELVLRDGWVLGRYPAVSLTPPIDWSFKDEASRSHNYHLHALDLIDPLLAAHSAGESDRPYLEHALAVAMDWVENHPAPDTPDRSPMAWYDMAVGLRAYRLAYVYDEARRLGVGTDAQRNALRASLEAHRANLVDDEHFAAHSNHGLYQASGQLAMARRLSDIPGMDAAAQQARERLVAAITAQFTPEGIHKEHSPGYHLRVLETLSGAERAGLLDTPELQKVVSDAREAMSWFVKPDGRLINIGDTDESRALPSLLKGLSPEGFKAFPRSGYVVARSPGFYFVQTLAYHSRTHKQADDLSFVWGEHGRDVLIDAGRYGYRGRTQPGSDLWKRGFWYGDPNRVFVESTHAHNTVEIGGESYNRREEQPYGSALIAAELTYDGLVVSVGEVDHGAQGKHRRLLILSPGQWLVLVDRVEPVVPAAKSRKGGLLGLFGGGGGGITYRQWFHFAPEFKVWPLSASSFAAEDPTYETRVRCVSLAPGVVASDVFVGQTEPRMQGWTSPRDGKMEPAPAVAMETSASGTAMFVTLMTLSVEDLKPGGCQVENDGDRLKLSWSADGLAMKLSIDGFLQNSAPHIELG
ncbi:MAG: heparinase II/III family protein [Caulobacteraceae bacterium]|nr:heparinase II/III family protein [Caulobacteraceae bacterium]